MKSFKEFLGDEYLGHEPTKSVKLQEAFEKKVVYKPEVGDDVRVPGTTVGQTIVGKVKKIGATMIHVELKDGTISAYPVNRVFKHDLSDEGYSKWNGKA
jgi:hypothetical protein